MGKMPMVTNRRVCRNQTVSFLSFMRGFTRYLCFVMVNHNIFIIVFLIVYAFTAIAGFGGATAHNNVDEARILEIRADTRN